MHLGLSEAEFRELTPRQYYVLMDAHQERVRHSEMLAGIIASTVANWSGRASKHLKPSTFMPSMGDEKPPAKQRTNRKQVANDLRAWIEMHRKMGQVVTTNPHA